MNPEVAEDFPGLKPVSGNRSRPRRKAARHKLGDSLAPSARFGGAFFISKQPGGKRAFRPREHSSWPRKAASPSPRNFETERLTALPGGRTFSQSARLEEPELRLPKRLQADEAAKAPQRALSCQKAVTRGGRKFPLQPKPAAKFPLRASKSFRTRVAAAVLGERKSRIRFAAPQGLKAAIFGNFTQWQGKFGKRILRSKRQSGTPK